MQVPDLKARHIVKVACGGISKIFLLKRGHFTIAITASMETFVFGTVDLVSRSSVFSSFIPHQVFFCHFHIIYQIGKYVDAYAGW